MKIRVSEFYRFFWILLLIFQVFFGFISLNNRNKGGLIH